MHGIGDTEILLAYNHMHKKKKVQSKKKFLFFFFLLQLTRYKIRFKTKMDDHLIHTKK